VAASERVAVLTDGKASITGGQVTVIEPIKSPAEWCDVYGVVVIQNVALLYKAVEANYCSQRGGDYTPGTIPVATDWDGGKKECGGGLHFSPRPAAGLAFNPGAEKFVACPVNLADISIHPDPVYPSKVKARCCCAATWEVDIDGEPVTEADRKLRDEFFAEQEKPCE
jgi:hypothetical protein